MHDLLKKLAGGDRRSIGRANDVVAEVLNDPSIFQVVFNGMLAKDPVIRMRAADAVEKITADHPELLQPYKQKLIREVARVEQQEVRWHVAQLISRLELNDRELRTVVEILLGYLSDKSSIVRTSVMQALADLAERTQELRPQVVKLLEELSKSGSPAMKSRGRRLLKTLNKPNIRQRK